MLIGILSDIHDHLDNLKNAISILNQKQVENIIFCGDFCSPIPAKVLATLFRGEIHCVFGNGDGDKSSILKFSFTENKNLIVHGDYADILLGGKRVAVTHFPFYAYALAQSGNHDVVFYGHSHISKTEAFGKTLCVNPGDVMGYKNKASMGLYDTLTSEITILELP